MSGVIEIDRRVGGFIVLLALLQGLLLYLAETGLEHGWWPFSELGGRISWYTLVLAVPSAMTLSVSRLDDRRFWQQALGIVAVYASLAAWAAWSATGAPGLESAAVLMPFGFIVAMGLFVSLPYLQCRLAHGRWAAPYPELFEYAWQNGLTLLLTLLFAGICWAVLYLWAGLFSLIEIDFFRDLFRERPFVYLATGAMVGLGILIGRRQQRPVRVARQVLFAVFKGLLPLLAFVAVLFVLSLPVTGLQPLWDTGHAAALLMSLMLAMILFANAVYQDGRGEPPYPAFLRTLVEAGLLSLPVYACLALWALWLRIEQYGWSAYRLWALLAGLLLAGYAFGYALAVVRRRTFGVGGMEQTNVAVSFAFLALSVAVNSPLLDPHRIATGSQIARLRDGRLDWRQFDAEHLRFQAGRRGYRALQALRADPGLGGQPELQAQIVRALDRPRRWDYATAAERAQRAKTVVQAELSIDLAAGAEAPGADYLQALVEGLECGSCLLPGWRCLLLTPDLDHDGSSERLLCDLDSEPDLAVCKLAAREAGGWRYQGDLHFWSASKNSTPMKSALREGRLQIQPRRWPEVTVEGSKAKWD